MKPVYYLHYDPTTGETTGTGFSPDGTILDGCIECTATQAALFKEWRVVDGAVVPVTPDQLKIVQADRQKVQSIDDQ